MKIMAIILLIALFPTVTFGIVYGLLGHPLFFLLLLLLFLAWPSIRILTGDKHAHSR